MVLKDAGASGCGQGEGVRGAAAPLAAGWADAAIFTAGAVGDWTAVTQVRSLYAGEKSISFEMYKAPELAQKHGGWIAVARVLQETERVRSGNLISIKL